MAEERQAPPAARAADPGLLARLAAAAGIAPAWHDLAGQEHLVPEGSLRALLGSLGLPAESAAQAAESLHRLQAPRALPASLTLAEGEPGSVPLGPPLAGAASPVALLLLRDDGSRQRLLARPEDGVRESPHHRRIALPPLPPGRHRLLAEEFEGIACRIAVVPAAAYRPADAGRRFGIAAQTYGLRRRGDQGIGDYAALAELARGGGALGASLIGISPPHALMPVDRDRPAPTSPPTAASSNPC